MSRELKDDMKGLAFFESHCLNDAQVLSFTRAFAEVCDRHHVQRVPDEWRKDPATHGPMLRQACAAIYAFAADVARLLCNDRWLVVIREADMKELLKFLTKHAGVSLAVMDLQGPRVLSASALEAFAALAMDCFGDLEKAASIVASQSFRFGQVTIAQVRDIVMPSRMSALLDDSTRTLLVDGPAVGADQARALHEMLERLQGEILQRKHKEAEQQPVNADGDVVG